MLMVWWVDAGWSAGAHQSRSVTSPAQQERGRENMPVGSWVEIRTERDHSPITVMGKTDLTWGKLI